MKTLGVSILLSAAALQMSMFSNELHSALGTPEFPTLVLTVLVMAYHIGVWRQRVETAKDGFAVELERFRQETNERFDRIMARLDAIDLQLAAFQDHRAATERWQGGIEARVERLETVAA